jgi:hypothetical protein
MTNDLWSELTKGTGRLWSDAGPCELWYSLDNMGCPRFILKHTQPQPSRNRLPEMKGIEILLTSNSKHNSIILCLKNTESKDIFGYLCTDIGNAVAQTDTETVALQIFFTRMYRWQSLLKRGSSRLSKQEQLGLWGELIFLHDVAIPAYNAEYAVSTWYGPDREPKDFVFGDIGIEIKTRLVSGRDLIRISSENQLALSGLKKLFLYVIDVGTDDGDSGESLTLCSLVNIISKILSAKSFGALEIFRAKLEAIGYREEDEYTEHIWLKQQQRLYKIGPEFPRIEANNLPSSIQEVTYSLKLSACEEFLVPDSKELTNTKEV